MVNKPSLKQQMKNLVENHKQNEHCDFFGTDYLNSILYINLHIFYLNVSRKEFREMLGKTIQHRYGVDENDHYAYPRMIQKFGHINIDIRFLRGRTFHKWRE